MDPMPITGQTRNLGKPKDWDDAKLGPCGSLPIRDEKFNGESAMVSVWKPSRHELDLLNKGALVQLHVIGYVHPPVALNVSVED